MKKYPILACALSLLALSNLHAGEVLLEAKGAYFGPTDHKFRKIYSGGGRYGGELSYEFCNCLYGWASVDDFSKSGRSIGEHHRTHITLVPIGIGLKYFISASCVDFYLGAGGLATYFHTKDHSPYVIESSHKWGFGGIAKLGALVNFNSFFIDLFGDYSWVQNLHFHNTNHGAVTRHSADINGWAVGVGIGFRFGGCCCN